MIIFWKFVLSMLWVFSLAGMVTWLIVGLTENSFTYYEVYMICAVGMWTIERIFRAIPDKEDKK